MAKGYLGDGAGKFSRSMIPLDHALMAQAERNVGDASFDAIDAEYDRLLAAKLKPKSLWARIFGD